MGIINDDSDFQEVAFTPTNNYNLRVTITQLVHPLPMIKNISLLYYAENDTVDIITWKNSMIYEDELCIDQVIDKILQHTVLNRPEYASGILVRSGARIFRIKFSRYVKIPNNIGENLYMCVYKIV